MFHESSTTRQPVRTTKIHQLARAFRRYTPVYLNCTRARRTVFSENQTNLITNQRHTATTVTATATSSKPHCLHQHCQQAIQTRNKSVYRSQAYYKLGWDILGIVTTANDACPIGPSLEAIYKQSRSLIEIIEAADQTNCLAMPLEQPPNSTFNMNETKHTAETVSHSTTIANTLCDIEAFLTRDLDPWAESNTKM
ncbi:hypothetical protein BDF22DRAFT_775459 [Syncephalis plumigaleata]|nr:hypothetical protein BDF22DRAFT_775459 [Syncephalis plumigaleata]